MKNHFSLITMMNKTYGAGQGLKGLHKTEKGKERTITYDHNSTKR